METATVTSKGQVVIPSKIRERYHVTRGTRVFFIEKTGEISLKFITNNYIHKMKGILKSKGRTLKELLKEKKKEREL